MGENSCFKTWVFLDIIFYKFLLEYEDKITDDELYELEGILDLPDSELLDILYKKTSIPSNLKDGILKKILEKCYAED